jgi:hypothetical protein
MYIHDTGKEPSRYSLYRYTRYLTDTQSMTWKQLDNVEIHPGKEEGKVGRGFARSLGVAQAKPRVISIPSRLFV